MIDSPLPSPLTFMLKGQTARAPESEANGVQDVFARLVGKLDTVDAATEPNGKMGRAVGKDASERLVFNAFESDTIPKKTVDLASLAMRSPLSKETPPHVDSDDALADMPVTPAEDATALLGDAPTIDVLRHVPSSIAHMSLNDADTESAFGSGVAVGLSRAVGPVSADPPTMRRGASEPIAPSALKAAPISMQADQPTSVPSPVVINAQTHSPAVANPGTTAIALAHAAPALPQEMVAQVPTILRISLRPAELGPVQVVIHTGTEGTTVRIVAETDAGYAALVNKGEVLTSLVRDLRAATVLPAPETGQQSLSFASDGQGGGRSQAGETGHNNSERNDATWRWLSDPNGTGQVVDDNVSRQTLQPRSYRTI